MNRGVHNIITFCTLFFFHIVAATNPQPPLAWVKYRREVHMPGIAQQERESRGCSSFFLRFAALMRRGLDDLSTAHAPFSDSVHPSLPPDFFNSCGFDTSCCTADKGKQRNLHSLAGYSYSLCRPFFQATCWSQLRPNIDTILPSRPLDSAQL